MGDRGAATGGRKKKGERKVVKKEEELENMIADPAGV